MILRIMFLFFSALFASVTLEAQVFHDQDFRLQAEKGLAFTYNLEFTQADRVFTEMKTRYKEYPGPDFLLAINRWWQSYISTTDQYHSYIEARLKSAIKLNEKLKERENYNLEYAFFQYMSFAFLTRLYILRKEWVKAANTGRKALPYLSNGLTFAEESPEFYFSSGIYHYYAEVYPREHYYVRPFTIFFPSGDAERGLEELEFASSIPNFTRTESLYYLGDIYLEEEANYPKALIIKRKLFEEYPNNTWFRADYARALVYAGRESQAKPVLLDMIRSFEKIKKHETRQVTSSESLYTTLIMMRVYNYMGKVAYHSDQDYQMASRYFQLSMKMGELAGVEMDPHLAINQYFLGRTYDQLGDPEKAEDAYRKALDMDENREVKALAEACLKRDCSN